MKADFLIITALQLEWKATEIFLQNPSPLAHPVTGSQYLIGDLEKYKVALVQAGAGNVKAAHETDRAILFFKPEYVFFVGIAGGVKDVKLGDVVVSTKVIGYETGKDGEEFKPRFESVQASYNLEQLAKKIARTKNWLSRVSDIEDKLKSFVAPIAAGEKVVSSNRSIVYEHINKYCSEALAVEMEGIGFLEATRPYDVKSIVIRGISDLLNNKEETDAAGFQPKAANHASAFAIEMIVELSKSRKPNLNDLEFKKNLIEKLNSLYENGPETDDIWKRAGGDTSFLINTVSRKSQWFSAIDRLSKGGGGTTITLDSLIREVQRDFPQTDILKELL